MGTAVTQEPQANAPLLERIRDERPPVVLTAQPLLRARTDLAQGLRNAQFELRFVADWDRMPEAAERIAADIVLVDLDAAEQSSIGTARPSGHRLVALLARQLARREAALVVITQLDFAEIEDLARAGVAAIFSPALGARALVTHLLAVLQRMRDRRSGSPVAVLPPGDGAERQREGGERGPQQPEDGHGPVGNADGWRLPEALWREIEKLLPIRAGAGKRRVSDRQIATALFYLLRTGASYSALPRAFGSGETVRRRLREWQHDGVLDHLRGLPAARQNGACERQWERLLLTLARVRPARRAPQH